MVVQTTKNKHHPDCVILDNWCAITSSSWLFVHVHGLCRLNSLDGYTVECIRPCHCVEWRPWGLICLLSSSSVFSLTEGDREVSGGGCLLFVAASWPIALSCILFSYTKAFLLGFVTPWLLFVVILYHFSLWCCWGRWRCLWLLSAALLCFSCQSTLFNLCLIFFYLLKLVIEKMEQLCMTLNSDFYHLSKTIVVASL